MKLTADQKIERARQRMLDKARQLETAGTYARRFVAPLFQRMIRAEAAALPNGLTPAVLYGSVGQVYRSVGFCVCVTCGKVRAWKGNAVGGGEIETGHFLASRRNSILFEETNVAPQCKFCNRHRSGEQQLFRKWMLLVRGADIVERLEQLKNTVRTFDRDELVDMRIGYAARLKAAEQRMLAQTEVLR